MTAEAHYLELLPENATHPYQPDSGTWNETDNNLAKNTKNRCAVVR